MSKSVAVTFGVAELPRELIEDDTRLKEFVRACIRNAVELGLEPDLSAVGMRTSKSLMAHLNDREASYLAGLMHKQGKKVPIGAAVGRMVEAAMKMTAQPAAPEPDGPDELGRVLGLAALPTEGRPEQRALYREITKALRVDAKSGPIVAAQASTGSGKTFIAQAVALDEGVRRRQCVSVVAFPTLHGVKAFAEQWHRTRQASNGTLSRLALMFGRREYVSQGAVCEVADTLEQGGSKERADALRAWATSQASKGRDDLVPAWMMDALLAVDEDLDREALAINASSDPEDAGVQAYEAQFLRAGNAQVIACSHAMLAVDVLIRWRAASRWNDFKSDRQEAQEAFFSEVGRDERAATRQAGGASEGIEEIVARLCIEHERAMLADGVSIESRRLPPYGHLVVDEAHQLEQAFSNIFSRTVSLRVTQQTLSRLHGMGWHGAKASIERACKVAGEAVDKMIEIGRDGEELRIQDASDRSGQVRASLSAMLAAIEAIKPPPEGVSTLVAALWGNVGRDAETVRQALNEKLQGQRLMSFTPVRRYPHLVIGSGDVRQPLSVLWAGVASAVLLSATFYMRRDEGWSARYCASLLSVPPTRLAEIPVIEAPWLYTPVQGLYLPQRVARVGSPGHWLRPPSRKDRLEGAAADAAKALWLEELLGALGWVFKTGQGGCLVLCTSIEQVDEIGLRLSKSEVASSGGEVLMSTKLRSLQKMRMETLRLATEGRRAVLVATGGGWTGFDVSGQAAGIEPSRDNVITDLVMVKLPFGMNRSLTHRTRVENPRDPVPHEMLSATVMTQQGIGRLVRTSGLPANRRIFVLDGRLVDPTFDAFMSPVKRVFSGYRRKELLLSEVVGVKRK